MRKERKWAGGFSSKETLRFSVGTGLTKRGGCPLLRPYVCWWEWSIALDKSQAVVWRCGLCEHLL